MDRDTFKICVLGSNNIPKKVIVFHPEYEKLERNKIFSEKEIEILNTYKVNVEYSKQQIHTDDSIRVVKNKIAKEISNVSYGDIYLFSQVKEKISIYKAYYDITKNEEQQLTNEILTQFLSNIKISEKPVEKETYSYEDLLNIKELNEPINIKIPLGQRFEKERDYLMTTNPFNLTTYVETKPMFSFENSLLFNYGKIEDNTIFVCLIEDVLQYASMNSIDEESVIKVYFPYLFAKNNIKSMDNYLEKKRVLIEDTKKTLTQDVFKLYETVDLFYDIYNKKKSELTYINIGVKSFTIILKTDFVNLLPLDAIFKNIHSTKNIPFIKYNPGFRRENIYRLYTEKTSKNGKKIPYLSIVEITKLSREIGKNGQISLYIRHIFETKPIDIYFDFQKNGNLYIHAELENVITKEELNQLLLNSLNPVIEDMNEFLEKTGYSIPKFVDLEDSSVTIDKIKYVMNIELNKKMDLKTYSGCIQSVFNIENGDIQSENGAILKYRRVENYVYMDPIDEFITNEKNKLSDVENIILALSREHGFDEKKASERVIKYFSEHTLIDDKVVENPGFPVKMKLNKATKVLGIEIENINGIHYLDTIKVFIDSIIRIYQLPESTDVPLKKVQSLCKKETNFKNIDKPNINTVISPVLVIQPIDLGVSGLDTDFFERVMEEDETNYDIKNDIEENVEKTPEIGVGMFNQEEEEEQEDEEEEEEEQEEEQEKEPEKKVSHKKTPEDEIGIGMINQEEEEEEEEQEEEQEKEPEKKVSHKKTPEDEIGIGMINQDEEEEEEEEEEEKKGGNDEELEVDLTNMKLNNPDYFQKRIQERDPEIVVNKEIDGFPQFSRAVRKEFRPVALNRKEMENNEKYERIRRQNGDSSYTTMIEYGTDEKHINWYICPRYWNLKTQTSMSEQEVNELLKKDPRVVIPQKAKTVPTGAYIYEFNTPKLHISEKGEYIRHYPGLKDKSHPKGYKLPICYSSQQKEKTDDLTSKKYVLDSTKFPIPSGRIGFLPPAIQSFFRINNNDYVLSTEPNKIKQNTPSFIRYGIETSPNKSIIAVFADIYCELNNVPLLTVNQMCNVIVDAIDLDNFVEYFNGSLVSIFRPKTYTVVSNKEKHMDTVYYKTYVNNPSLLNETIASYNNFCMFIRDETSFVEHTYIWDIITKPNPKLLKDGLNMVIFKIPNDTELIEVICPTITYRSSLFDESKKTLLLLKQNDFYEPIYLYENKGRKNPEYTRFFDNSNEIISKVLLKVNKHVQNYCKAKPSLPKEYDFKTSKNAEEVYKILTEKEYTNIKQVVNYQSKTVGFYFGKVFVPCSPSGILKNIEKVLVDNEEIWKDYTTTINELNEILSKTGLNVTPSMKIVDENNIIGIVTKTNQYVRIFPPSPVEDLKDSIPSVDYIQADKDIALSNNEDQNRISVIRNIELESNFYVIFRSTIRILLGEYKNRKLKHDIIEVLDNNQTYKEKLYEIEKIIRELVGDVIVFQEMDDDVLDMISELSTYNKNCENKKYGISLNDDKDCQVVMPYINLNMGISNEKFYYSRVSDEILRFRRIRSFLLEPNNYLNLTNQDYKVNKDEILILESSIKQEQYKDLEVFNTNKYVQNISFENAEPIKAQKYSNNVKNEVY